MSIEAKASLDEVMAHVGVKGMKWGHVKSDEGVSSGGSGSGSTKKSKPTTQDIHAARFRQNIRERKYESAVGDYMVARTNKGQDAAEKVMRSLEKDLYLGKDAKTANKYTKGEKIATGIAYGVAGAMVAATIAVAAAGNQRL